MISMRIAVFLVLLIAQQSYGRSRCSASGYTTCTKAPIACTYGKKRVYDCVISRDLPNSQYTRYVYVYGQMNFSAKQGKPIV